MALPLAKTRAYSAVQVQEPMFCKRQVLVKASPGRNWAPSGTVTSLTNFAQLQGMGVAVGVGGTRVGRAVGAVVGGAGVAVASCGPGVAVGKGLGMAGVTVS
ncbi:hypothetical protein SE15_00750 [Thermanaerothrix daxensis]|uniref:Uncharacterized protein n=1 Tax=Thermanaerothrix daxensis TaxID=869279 RepID=A0A0P6YFR0_9CHLR|nr:hypothetical protein SE15_00750 [Thermanaerothrix daxensis]